MSHIPKTTVAITAFHHTSGYQYIRPKTDDLITAAQFLNMIVTAPTLEEAKERLSKQPLSWDYYTNWMDGQKDLAKELATNKKVRKKIKKAPLNIAGYLKGVELSQRLIQIDVDLAKYPLYSAKWRKTHETYLITFAELKEEDPDYTSLFPEAPSIEGYTLNPFIEKLSETGYFLALAYTALAYLEKSTDDLLTEEAKQGYFELGFDYLDKACARGSDEAIITMGDIYRKMLDEDDDPKNAQKVYMSMIKHYDLATRRGSPNAKARLGNALLNPQTRRDPKTGIYHGSTPQVEPALKFLNEAAAEDSTFAYFYLGMSYLNNTKINRAIEFFEKAAKNEHINSMNELDTLYAKKIKQSKPVLAAQLKTKAAENMYMMGYLYETGHCLTGKPNFKEAQTCYLKSLKMDIGDSPAPQIKSALALNRLALEGKELPAPNARLAFAYLKKAADFGDMNAVLRIACLFIHPNDPTLKEDWAQGRFYLDKVIQTQYALKEQEATFIYNTIYKLIAQTDRTSLNTQDMSNRHLQLNEFILDLAKFIHATDIMISAYKAIGFAYAYMLFDKVKAISYCEQALALGDLNAYLDIGFICLDNHDPNISYAMNSFKTGVKKGIDLTEDRINSIEAKLFVFEHEPTLQAAFDKAIYYDIKFLRDYNWIEHTFFSGEFASSQDQKQIPHYIKWLEAETVLDKDHIEGLLAGFRKCYPKAC